jgi:hypothetical protein
MYRFLDIFFVVFHSSLILFILFGWIARRTRVFHLLLVLGTAFFWFVVGIWYGFGYCPCTDWHWQVRYALGHTDMPNSYIKFLIDTVTGWDANANAVDAVTVISLVVVTGLSVYMNLRDLRQAKPDRNIG